MPKGPQVNEQAAAEIRRLYGEEELTIRAIACRLGLSYGTVHRHVSLAGIPFRPRGGRGPRVSDIPFRPRSGREPRPRDDRPRARPDGLDGMDAEQADWEGLDDDVDL